MPSLTLQVLLHDVLVGELRLDEKDMTEFRLFESYKSAYPRPVLGQQFLDDMDAVWRARSRLPSWFSNLLPEGPLRELLAKAAGVHVRREFFLLRHLGDDLPGAVRLRSDVEAPQEVPFQTDEVAEPAEEKTWHFSLAGVQLKFSANRRDRGLTVPVSGQGGDWIVKLPDARLPDVPRNEFATMHWAKLSGIEVPEFSLIRIEDISGLPEEVRQYKEEYAFAIRRFDRVDGKRIHMEDFAQILGLFPEQKYSKFNYETIGGLLLSLTGAEGLKEFIRRLVFIGASGNGDAHHKNWSVLYPNGTDARLSPAYDLVSTIEYLSTDKLSLNFAKSKEWSALAPAGFRRLAEKLDVPEDLVIEEARHSVNSIRTSWTSAKMELGYSAAAVKTLDAHLQVLWRNWL